MALTYNIASSVDPEKIMIVCGEASGDLHGAALVREIRNKLPKAEVFGIGGNLMRREGFMAFFKSEDLSVMGITDVIANYGVIKEAKELVEFAIISEMPDLLVLIDYPGFNLRLAEFAKKHGVKVLYYISPKIWAWNIKRIAKIKKFVDHLALILPFEKQIYESFGVSSTFVGNPILDRNVRKRHNRSFEEIKKSPVIGLLPGSRPGEVKRHLKILLESALLCSGEFDAPKFILSFACESEKEFFFSMVAKYQDMIDLTVETESVDNIFEKVDFLVAASGTVTLEAAVANIPMIIIYRVSSFTYYLARLFVKTKHIGLASIIAGREVIPELIQYQVRPTKIRDHILYYLNDEEIYNNMIEDLKMVEKSLGTRGVSSRVSEIIMDMIK